MKKLLSLLLVAMMLVGLLAGCGSEPAPASNPPAADGLSLIHISAPTRH